MKNRIKFILGGLVLIMISSTRIFAQEVIESEDFSPAIIVITTFHWNSDFEKDFSSWKIIEQEYFDKVTSKNDLILGSGVYTHVITPDDSEVLFVSVYNSWEDIEKAKEVTNELIKEGWQDESEREAFFDRQDSFYNGEHSSEIVSSMPFQKNLHTNSKEPLIYYVRKNRIGQGGEGYNEYFENIIMKNNYIKGYYTHRQLYGSNSKDAVEIAVFESLADFESSHKETEKLVKEYWSDEDARKEFFKEFRKIFSGHGDYIYQNVPELAK